MNFAESLMDAHSTGKTLTQIHIWTKVEGGSLDYGGGSMFGQKWRDDLALNRSKKLNFQGFSYSFKTPGLGGYTETFLKNIKFACL